MTSRTTPREVLRVRELRVLDERGHVLAGPHSFSLNAGECFALVGDSGSGKTLTLRALINLLPPGLSWSAEELTILGRDARSFTHREWQSLRGKTLGLVQQDAGDALDPLKHIQSEVLEAARVHHLRESRSGRAAQATVLLNRAGLKSPETLLHSWPHELSGGMRQRAVLASALSAQPRILLADEPTTALDATVQRTVLETLDELTSQGLAIILVSHDERSIAQVADRSMRLMPVQPLDTFSAEKTDSELAAHEDSVVSDGGGMPALRVQSLSAGYPSNRNRMRSGVRPDLAIEEISFTLAPGQVLGVVGESGAGKTTLARVLTATLPVTDGEVWVHDVPWSQLSERNRRPERWRVQWVPQDPLASFARGMTVESILGEAVASTRVERNLRDARIDTLMSQVGLDPRFRKRRPRTLSGGQRQRLAIARALATRPQILICDEAVSALDASAREGILRLLVTLARTEKLAMVFVSHDIEVISRVSDEILVMQDGRVVEQGSASRVLGEPEHPFTQALIADSGYSR